MTVAGIHTEAVLHLFFSLSYLAIHVLFESGRIISNVTIPFDCLPVAFYYWTFKIGVKAPGN